MSTLEIWNKVARPPKEALKTIKGGRLSGMTDVNPQWRLKVMTENFGPCGKGWKYTIDKLWNEPGPEGVVMAFALVSVQVVGSDPIQGVGGSMLVAKESAGLRANDEGYKMAVTDALSTALKTLGVAADIYAGLWDGTKYQDSPNGSKPLSVAGQEWEDSDEETKKFLGNLADQVKDILKTDGGIVAMKYLEEQNLLPEEKVAIWSRFDSKERAAMEPHKRAKKAA